MSSNNKAIFIDKDGTLIQDVPYNTDPEKVKLTYGAVNTLAKMALLDYKFVVISNQQGIANGKITELQLKHLIDRLKLLLSADNINLSGFYYCPHDERGIVKKYAIKCVCKKPLPGLIFKAAEQLDIDLDNSWMIGDILNDVEAGNRAGCKTILFDCGNETEWIKGAYRVPDFTVKSWNEIIEIIESWPNIKKKSIEAH